MTMMLLKTGVLSALTIALGAMVLSPDAQAQIAPATLNDTGTIVTPNGLRFNITGGTQAGGNLFHSFQRFGLNATQTANFVTNPAIQNVLGRVVGGSPSVINGLIQVTGSNANLYLMNPAGIVFGPSASLNVPAAFTATTATAIGLGNQWFSAVGSNNYGVLLGNPSSFAFAVAQPGAIVNAGTLAVGQGQNLSLLGGMVVNTGTLTAPEGQITVMAVPGSSLVRLSQPGSLLSLEIQPIAPTSTLTPATLPELLTIGNSQSPTGLTVNGSGQVVLTSSGAVVPTESGSAIVSGSVTVAGQNGGQAQVLGTQVGLMGAAIEATGSGNGGTVLVGGDYQGRGTVPNAIRTYVSANSTIRADSLLNGNGGRAIVWADGTTAFYGNLSARGGSVAGNGGLAEVSGKQNLIFSGSADLSAAWGTGGTLLLDPTNILISNAVADTPGLPTNPFAILGTDFPGMDVTISQATLEALPGNTNITLEATNDITIGALTGNKLTLSQGTGTFTFRADSDLDGFGTFVMSNPSSKIVLSGRTTLIAGARINISGGVDTRGDFFTTPGSVRLEATREIVTGTIQTFADEGTTLNAGNITIISQNGSIDTSGGVLAAGAFNGNGGTVTLEAFGNITTAGIRSYSVGNSGIGGDIILTSRTGTIDVSKLGSNPITNGNELDLYSDSINGNSGSITLTALLSDIITTKIWMGTSRGSGGALTLIAGRNIVTGDIVNPGYDPTLPTNGGVINFGAGGSITTGSIDSSGGKKTGVSGPGYGGSITLNAGGNITTNGTVIADGTFGDGKGGNITLISGNGTIDTRAGLIGARAAKSGTIDISTQGNIFTGQIQSQGGNVTLKTKPGGSGRIDTSGGTLDLSEGSRPGSLVIDAQGDVVTGNISTSAVSPKPGKITIDSRNGEIDTSAGSLSARSGVSTGNTITLTAAKNITANTIITGGEGGNISLSSNQGSVRATAIQTKDTQFGDGGSVSITAKNEITLGSLDTQGGLNSGGGAITLDAGNQITVTDSIQLGSSSTRQGLPLSLKAGGTVLLPATIDTNGADIRSEAPASQLLTPSTGSTINTNGGRVSLAVASNLTIDPNTTLNTNGGDINLTSLNDLTINGTLNSGAANANGGNITLTSINGGIDTQQGQVRSISGNGNSGSIALIANTDITVGDLLTRTEGNNPGDAGNIALTTPANITTGSLQSNSANGAGGGITLTARNVTLTREAIFGSNVNRTSNPLTLDLYGTAALPNKLTTNGANITTTQPIAALTSLTGNTNINTLGGVVSLRFSGDVTLSGINITTSGGDVIIRTPGNLTIVQPLNTASTRANGGSIFLNSVGGALRTSDLTTNGVTGGGNAFLFGQTEIKTGQIDTSASVGKGGQVVLNRSNNVSVGWINAQGGTNGQGGEVDITARNFFVASSSFTALNGQNASISTIGGQGGGNITIRHDGGAQSVPFILGNPALNGTAGTLTTGAYTLAPPEAYPGPFTLGNIRLITASLPLPNDRPAPPPLTIADELPFALEEIYTREFDPNAGYPGGTNILSLSQLQQTLIDVDQELESTSALVYVSFTPNLGSPDPNQPRNILCSPGVPEILTTLREGSFLKQDPSPCDRLTLSVVTRFGLTTPIVLAATRQEVAASATLFQSTIRNPRADTNESQKSGQQLYQWLVRPLEGLLDKQYISNLSFIMPQETRLIPIAALYDGKQYLVQRYSSNLLPSLSLTKRQRTFSRKARVLAMGATQFNIDNLPPLKEVENELQAILSVWPGQSFMNEAFTFANLNTQRRQNQFDIVHLATHGKIDSDGKFLIYLANEKFSSERIKELNWSNPPLELLVLSACDTASEGNAGQGFAGIAHSLGVKSVIGSLWSVQSDSTALLMAQFYRNLKSSPIKVEALRQAQITILTNPNSSYRSPFFWAPFVMVGNPW
jgi:filamentous hemagglutinin family protein